MPEEFKGARLFLNIPVEVAHDPRIKSDKSVLLFGEIYSMLNVTGSFFMSNEKMAKRIRARSTRTVQRCLDELESLGYISRKITRDPETNEVVKREITSDWHPGVIKDTRVVSSNAGGSCHQMREGRVTDGTIIEHTNRTANRTVNNIGQARPDDTTRKKIIDYLNSKLGTCYKPNASKNKWVINARLNEGYTFNDFKKVIDNKFADWEHDANMSKYLRPETLFGTKMEGYVNEKHSASTDTGYHGFADDSYYTDHTKVLDDVSSDDLPF